ncbi:hypothetical protein TPHA_0G02080 [Tetrapisispora phaffii CBS 4417]|uniref:Protein SIP5 n=1 Tax=Tetrapisispora phaffii (strain ATCC 24235 / CBS 4417 / NBRC 1672 / NRRL Y-8282 / UCD 70-5) TaxID=1071381 RepID=G8BVW6_TETPH|nr:hypothetical protein TPHA_0G02080 [Tetrapisispora phaffii CBS 4417]CCE64044.1 hypothetical protein TPHA_0G02080 [Tetrapisispora phaffii CBS 4417]
MGNVPGKLEDENRANDVNVGPATLPRTISDTSDNSRSRRGNTSSLVNGFLRSNERNDKDGKMKTLRQRELQKEQQAKELVINYKSSVDGGYLAPFGCYSFDKLDYNAKTVKTLIKRRQLAPFYTPLQDYDASWTDEELIKIVDGLPLHSVFEENLEEFEGIPTGDLYSEQFDHLINNESGTMSKRERKKMHNLIFKARLYKKRIIWQEIQNNIFLEKKLYNKNILKKNNGTSKLDQYLPSDELKLQLYRNGKECPICFLYYPNNLNCSKCCQQPICTECFVQIKRSHPHFPHDEDDKEEEDKDPQLLTSEPAKCPYCASENFTITYKPLKDNECGYHSIPLIKFKKGSTNNKYDLTDEEDLSSVSKTDSGTDLTSNIALTSQDPLGRQQTYEITSDTIRPNWEERLKKEISKLERRSANATAIHVSNRLIQGSNGNNQESQNNLNDLEQQMIEQAIKLSLKENSPKKKK